MTKHNSNNFSNSRITFLGTMLLLAALFTSPALLVAEAKPATVSVPFTVDNATQFEKAAFTLFSGKATQVIGGLEVEIDASSVDTEVESVFAVFHSWTHDGFTSIETRIPMCPRSLGSSGWWSTTNASSCTNTSSESSTGSSTALDVTPLDWLKSNFSRGHVEIEFSGQTLQVLQVQVMSVVAPAPFTLVMNSSGVDYFEARDGCANFLGSAGSSVKVSTDGGVTSTLANNETGGGLTLATVMTSLDASWVQANLLNTATITPLWLGLFSEYGSGSTFCFIEDPGFSASNGDCSSSGSGGKYTSSAGYTGGDWLCFNRPPGCNMASVAGVHPGGAGMSYLALAQTFWRFKSQQATTKLLGYICSNWYAKAPIINFYPAAGNFPVSINLTPSETLSLVPTVSQTASVLPTVSKSERTETKPTATATRTGSASLQIPPTPLPPTPVPPTPTPPTPSPPTPAPTPNPPGVTPSPPTPVPPTPAPTLTPSPPTPIPPTPAPTPVPTTPAPTPLPPGDTFAPPTPVPTTTEAPTTTPVPPTPAPVSSSIGSVSSSAEGVSSVVTAVSSSNSWASSAASSSVSSSQGLSPGIAAATAEEYKDLVGDKLPVLETVVASFLTLLNLIVAAGLGGATPLAAMAPRGPALIDVARACAVQEARAKAPGGNTLAVAPSWLLQQPLPPDTVPLALVFGVICLVVYGVIRALGKKGKKAPGAVGVSSRDRTEREQPLLPSSGAKKTPPGLGEPPTSGTYEFLAKLWPVAPLSQLKGHSVWLAVSMVLWQPMIFSMFRMLTVLVLERKSDGGTLAMVLLAPSILVVLGVGILLAGVLAVLVEGLRQRMMWYPLLERDGCLSAAGQWYRRCDEDNEEEDQNGASTTAEATASMEFATSYIYSYCWMRGAMRDHQEDDDVEDEQNDRGGNGYVEALTQAELLVREKKRKVQRRQNLKNQALLTIETIQVAEVLFSTALAFIEAVGSLVADSCRTPVALSCVLLLLWIAFWSFTRPSRYLVLNILVPSLGVCHLALGWALVQVESYVAHQRALNIAALVLSFVCLISALVVIVYLKRVGATQTPELFGGGARPGQSRVVEISEAMREVRPNLPPLSQRTGGQTLQVPVSAQSLGAAGESKQSLGGKPSLQSLQIHLPDTESESVSSLSKKTATPKHAASDVDDDDFADIL